MNIQDIKNQWKTSFDEAIKSIENHIKYQEHQGLDEKKHVELSQWLLSTTVSPYDFMPHSWQNFKCDPFSTDALLCQIHHALVDDGDICFVSLNLENKTLRHFIMFYPSYDDSFEQECFKENSHLIQSYINGRESHHRVMKSMIEKFPEKTFSLKPLISDKDFTFVVHQNPLLFIQQVETLEKNNIAERLEMDKKMATLRNKK